MRYTTSAAFVAATMTLSGQALADEATRLGDVSVIGSKEAATELPGSASYIDRQDITRQGYDDINRILRETPGVYVREEDGYGLFPNISIRGADPGRSSKVTIMEDGVLMAPAPYAAPAAYYSPTVGRMSGVEVVKGSSQVRFGPRTTGGIINYLSTPIPQTRSGYLRSAFGTDSEFRNQLWFGDSVEGAAGEFGYLVELYHRQTDGFKEMQGPASDLGPDAGDTGFRRVEPMIKLAWAPDTALDQRLELTYGRSELDADETYLGITTADFARNPNLRYAASQFDNIRTQQERAILRYSLAPTEALSLDAKLYRTDFARNWDKIRQVNGNSLSAALAQGGNDLATLRGEQAGTWGYRDNNREYYAQGAEFSAELDYATGDIGHTLRVGVRRHEDEVFRFQRNKTYNVNAQGQVVSLDLNPPGSQDNRKQQAEATAVYAENAVRIGALTLTPGVRFEQIDWTVQDFRGATPDISEGDEGYVTGGLGFNYALGAGSALFGGVYQGFSPPSPGDGIAGEDAEESVSVELGGRFRTAGGIAQELVLFGTLFDNLLVPDNAGASGTADNTASVGEVETYGLEYALNYDPGRQLGWRFGTPLSLAATYTSAEIANDSNAAGDPESIFSGGRDGAELPYIPDFQISATAGVEGARWSLSLRALYVDEAFATALNTEEEVILGGDANNPQVVPDARGGKIDSQFVIDLTARYALTERVSVFANAFNLLDREYIASRLPEGPRPGAPQTFLAGIEANFY
ncbi:TonB-dependent receptor family protein [Algiphilus aromaticivorans]|uniref:TonB-dependent receptor family protein n=1 Tax=Algiphilus aromaticivorans TaxID=382454 RepID=UPI0018DD09CB|nr:TonB-dependent receptor [Algiphilus aromaticivorans]